MENHKPVPFGNAYELLVQGVMDYAIYMLDPDGHVVSWNPGAEKIKGYSAAEIIGQHFSRFYTEEDREAGAPAKALGIATATGRFTAEAWRLRKDGTRFWAMVVIDPIRQHGKLVGFAKITRDMTEQRQAQLAALESERHFRLLVQGVKDHAIFMLNPDGVVTNWNAGAARIMGYAESDIVGQHLSRFHTPEDVAQRIPEQTLEQARVLGHLETEAWRVRQDGTHFWASIVIDPIYDAGVLVGFAKITRDLTEWREAQLELERSREQLFQSQKMDAVGQLTGGLAHDFNNLLMGIMVSLELLRTRVGQGKTADLERYIGAAENAAQRAASLTHRLLAFARRQALDPKPTDANRLVANMQELVQRTVGPGIAVETTLAADLWPISCDANQLENAILNLCLNGRDAMPNGGRLVIETANVTLNERAAREYGLGIGPYVTVSVTDAGTGMAPDVVARAFDPFFTTKPIGRGTGLGLSMVYGFAQQSGGQVRILSQLGTGTSVRIYLPQYHGKLAEEIGPTSAPEPLRAQSGDTVLVVEDEANVRAMVKESLEELGYAAIEAVDGAAGLKILQSDTRIDLLITDVGLPGGMNGRQMADAARVKRPGLKVLFITGYAENAAIGEGQLEAGMYVLSKPFAIEALASRITGILAGRDTLRMEVEV